MRSFSHYNSSLDGIIDSVFITGQHAIVTFRDTFPYTNIEENSQTLAIACTVQPGGNKLLFMLKEETNLPVPPMGAIVKMQQLLAYLAPSQTDRDFLRRLPEKYTQYLDKQSQPRYRCSVPSLIASQGSLKANAA
ncbi:MAG: hypothetical protein K0R63_787 [Rickettsiales bacterium]|nr:hypothetical protein [Rickettsiales bacterium]